MASPGFPSASTAVGFKLTHYPERIVYGNDPHRELAMKERVSVIFAAHPESRIRVRKP
jgi:hypothetical protein